MSILKGVLSDNRIDKWLFIVAAIVLIFCFISKNTNVYQYGVGGAIFEILWLPMLIGIFIVPIICIAKLITQPIKANLLAIYSLLISIAAILILQFA